MRVTNDPRHLTFSKRDTTGAARHQRALTIGKLHEGMFVSSCERQRFGFVAQPRLLNLAAEPSR